LGWNIGERFFDPLKSKVNCAVPIEVKDPGMTAIMEGSLSKIASGELTLDPHHLSIFF
jgi:DNA topoisomerase IA